MAICYLLSQIKQIICDEFVAGAIGAGEHWKQRISHKNTSHNIIHFRFK